MQISTTLELCILVSALSLLYTVTFVQTHQFLVSSSVKWEVSTIWTLMYMQLESTQLCLQPKISGRIDHLGKSKEAAMKLETWTPPQRDLCYASILMRRSCKDGLCPHPSQEGGWELVFPGKKTVACSQTSGEPSGPSLPGFLILPEITSYTSSWF